MIRDLPSIESIVHNRSIYLRNTSNELNITRCDESTRTKWRERVEDKRRAQRKGKKKNLHEKWYH